MSLEYHLKDESGVGMIGDKIHDITVMISNYTFSHYFSLSPCEIRYSTK